MRSSTSVRVNTNETNGTMSGESQDIMYNNERSKKRGQLFWATLYNKLIFSLNNKYIYVLDPDNFHCP